ncbi:MAG: RNase H family protein [Actinomycetota bacterium]
MSTTPDSSRSATAEPATAEPTVIYTDGACSGNPGPGGWAWATTDGRQGQGGADTTTNQRMELQAVLEALLVVRGPAVVHSDSTYVVNCFNDRWYEGWKQRGWKNAQRKPVANRDLWEPLIDLYLPRRDELEFRWVKGHAGDPMNELVDALAVEESTMRKEAAAVGATTGGDPSTPGGSVLDGPLVPQPPWPVDQAIAVTGVADPDDDQTGALVDAIGGLDPGYDIVVSGLRRGVELAAAELAVRHGVSLAVVLPFPDPAARWPKPTLARFEACVAAADWVVTLTGDPAAPGTAVAARNEWQWRAAVGAIIVGEDALVARLDELGLGVIAID